MAEKAVDEEQGAVVGRGPAMGEKAGVVEGDDAAGDYVGLPIVPVLRDGGLAVVIELVSAASSR